MVIEDGILLSVSDDDLENGTFCFPDGVIVIGKLAFACCETLTELVIPGSVRKIGAYAFYKCAALSGVVISDGLERIGRRAFAGCSSLKVVNLPQSILDVELPLFN